MTHLTLSFLGPPEVTFAGEPLKFRSRKVLGLLIYLVLSGERQSREKLVDLLWPTSDSQRGMASLRNTVVRLKQALEPAGDFLLVERGYVGFDFSQSFDLDVAQLQTAVSPQTSLANQIDTLTRYRGDFLDGFDLPDAPDFEQWTRQQRLQLAQQWETLFTLVAQQQLDAGNGRSALETAARLAQIMPTSEPATQLQMKAHALSGNPAAALRVFEQFTQRLAAELGVAPAKETAVLAQQIRKGQHAQDATVPLFVTERPSLQIPFIGRSKERKLLQHCYVQARQGHAHVALIAGEAGQGKTALANSFLSWAALQSQAPDIIRGRAFEMGGHLPYQPLIDGMRTRLNEENAPEDLLDDVWLAELSQLLPELRSRYPDLPQPMAGNPDFVRARLFEAMATLGIALGEKRPFILYIDDLQWADAGTLDMLLYLIQRFTAVHLPMLFLITVRQAGLQQPALRDWRQQVVRQNALAQIDLEPLSEHSLQQLFSQLTQQFNLLSDEAKQLGHWLHRQTNGSPFFMTALLQTLFDEDLLVGDSQADGQFVPDLSSTLARVQAADRIPLPPTVRDVVRNQLNQLTERAHTLLLAAAVIGRACTFERLCQLAGLELFAALPALEELLAGRMMLEMANAERPLTIAHDNIREVLYNETILIKLQLYHRQLLTILEQDNAPAAELAFHAGYAGLAQKSFDYSMQAGDQSLAVHAFTDAIAFYEQAMDEMDFVTISVDEACALCVHYGRSLELSGRYQQALAFYQEVERDAQKSRNQPLELTALVAQGTIYATANELSDFALGEQVGQRALALAQSLGDQAAEARLQWNMLNIYRMTSRDALALQAGKQAIALGEALGLQEVTAYATNDMVYIYMAMGDVEQVIALSKKAIALWRVLGNQAMLTDSLINYANTQAMLSEYDLALNIASEALAISQSLNNLWAQSFSFYTYSLVHWRTLVTDKALAAMNQSIQLGEQAGFTGAQVLVRVFQAQLRLALGDDVGAAKLVETAVAIATESIPLFLLSTQGAAALVALQSGNLPQATFIIADQGLANVPFNLMNFLTPETAVCQHLLATGAYEVAIAASRRTIADLRAQNLRMYLPEFLYFQGAALAGLDQKVEARTVLYEALALMHQTNDRLWYAEIVSLLIKLERELGMETAVANLHQEAKPILQSVLDHIPEGQLRDAFFQLPTVQSLWAAS